MARTGLDDLSALPDLLQIWNWDLIVANPPGGGDGRALKVKCQSVQLPGIEVEPIVVPLHGVEIQRAGRQTFTKQLPITVVETRDLTSRDTLLNWAKFARDARANTGNYAANYTVDADIVLYDDTGTIIRTIRLHGCWLMKLDDTQMQGDQSALVLMNGVLSYDSFEDL